jgi:hypothetical protein
MKLPTKKGKKNRKHGRNKVFCARYKAEDRRAKNKARNVARQQHLEARFK